MWLSTVSVPLVSALLVAVLLLLLRRRIASALRSSPRTVAFLHPFCNDGGGGERVLWVAVRELMATHPGWRVVVYTGDAASDDEIRAHALSRFGVAVPASVVFVRLRTRKLIEPKLYPVATLIFQAAGSVVLAAEAVVRAPAHVLVDTTGLHFCLPLLRALGVPSLACYVHYPIISSDMVSAVASRKAAHNNAALFARLAFGAYLKLAYYRLLVAAYRRAGRTSDVTMANGSWTAGHLTSLWGVSPSVVFPPCDTLQLQALPLSPPPAETDAAAAAAASRLVSSVLATVTEAARSSGLPRGRLVLSVAQFRPEKDHAMQLRAFAKVLAAWRALGAPGPRPLLVVAGAVRHADDQRRLDELRALTMELMGSSFDSVDGGSCADGAEGSACGPVLFAPNLPLPALRLLLGHAAVGLHTMWNEHFGIGVVEMLAAGVATVAHRSGGPALDIIDDGATGLLAATDDEYAAAINELLLPPRAETRRAALAAAGRASVSRRFSEQAFTDGLLAAMAPVMQSAS